MLSRICRDLLLSNQAVLVELATYKFDRVTDEPAIFTTKRVPADFTVTETIGTIDKPWVRIQESSSSGEIGTRTRRAHRVGALIILTGPQDYDTERMFDIGRKISRVVDRGKNPTHDQVDVHGIWAGAPVDGGTDQDGFERITISVEALLYEPVI